jgi:ribosomal protein L19
MNIAISPKNSYRFSPLASAFFSRTIYAIAVSCYLLMPCNVYTQGVRGKISDEAGNPLSFATIFVAQTGSGAISNAQGTYEIRLAPGRYELSYQFLGYHTILRSVEIQEQQWLDLDIRMETQPIELKMSGINLGDEDPAYTVMRKAIAKAAWHRQQLDRYSAEVYIKGSGRLINAPFLVRKSIKKEGIDSTLAFTSESISQIEYQRPNTFTEKVIAVRSQGDDFSTSPMPFINSSFYENTVSNALSPLSPKAFAHYRFKLESFFMDRQYGINKIKVTPRNPGENLFDGYLFIIEDSWSIYSVQLGTFQSGFRFDIEQIFSPIQDLAWLPVSQKYEISGKIMGFSIAFNYLATLSKYQISLNPDLPAEAIRVIDEKVEKEIAEELRQELRKIPSDLSPQEKLASGQELTRKELRKILNEYEKAEQQELETPEITINTSTSVDSQAYKKDSLYWELIRPVPLSEQELKGYRFIDSVVIAEKKEQAEKQESMGISVSEDGESIQIGNAKGGFQAHHLLLGGSYPIGKTQRLTLGGPLLRTYFNPVEGFNITDSIGYQIKEQENTFGASVRGRYAFARNRFSPVGRIYFSTAKKPLNTTAWEIQGGRFIFQFNERQPIGEWLNTYQALFRELNFIRWYEKDFARFDLKKVIGGNYTFNTGFEWAHRSHLANRTTQTWFPDDNNSYASNDPNAEELILPLPTREKAAIFRLGITARPWQKYQLRNGKKTPLEGSSPTLSLSYRKGIEGLWESHVNYDYLEAGFHNYFRTGAYGTLDVRVEAGIFLNKASVGFADYRHFMGNQIAAITADPTMSYRLLDYYVYSTRDKFASIFAHQHFRKLLLTRITPVWVAGLKENLFINYLSTPKATNYFEIGYGLENIFRFFRIEAAASFEGGKYKDAGIFLGVSTSLNRMSQLF